MRQAMFNPNTQGPDGECFTAGIQDPVLQHTPSASFGSLREILALCLLHRINDVTTMVVTLGEAETRQQQKGVRMVS